MVVQYFHCTLCRDCRLTVIEPNHAYSTKDDIKQCPFHKDAKPEWKQVE